MAIMSGYKGRLILETTAGAATSAGFLNLTTWKVSMTRDEWVSGSYCTTAESTPTWKEAEAGHVEWSGSCEGYMDGTTNVLGRPFDQNLMAKPYTISLVDVEANTYQGDCKITGMEIENSHDGFVTYSATFRGLDTLTLAATT